MKWTAAIIALSFLTMTPPNVVSQDRVSLEFSPGVAVATSDLGDADLGIGFGFEALLAYRVMPHLTAYGGWGWHHFGSEDGFGGADLDVEETGYTFGFRFIHPLMNRAPRVLLGAGAVYNHIELENDDGDIVEDSGHGFGWQAEAGIAMNAARTWEIIPTIRYRALTREIETAGTSVDVDLNYVTFRVGVRKTF